ncbi:MAG: SPOR domain-containing protein [Gemmatimonadaceae bacterium]|nr:SPOR domain-containing protein [Gemmatimonadaceae bacterium]
MRLLLAFALVLAACGPADRSSSSAAHDAPSASLNRGPDPLVLRVERAGGRARVYAYDQLDSLVWSASGMPRLGTIVGFDPDQGVIAFVDSRNVPGRIDLRMGSVSQAGSRFTLTGARTADGGSVYGISGGKAVRFTDAGPWEFDPARELSTVFPQPDGALVAMSRRREGSAQLWRLFPPQTRVLDSALVEGLTDGPRLQGGDRIYLGVDNGVAVVNARTLDIVPPIVLETAVRDMAATPSGDRLFIAVESDSRLSVYERYRGQLGTGVPLPGEARALRMDPLGRYLLVRPAQGDSAWVVAVGTRSHVGTVRTAWRPDLPFVGADGRVATAQGDDVVFVDGATLRAGPRIAGGAADHWYPFNWSGFRPRAEGLDRPVEFQVDTGTAAPDTTGGDASSTPPAASPAQPPRPGAPQWMVSFASLLLESPARVMADEITVEGQRARVETSLRDGSPVYRVVLGPYSQREAAERVGRAAGRPYWVYSATP